MAADCVDDVDLIFTFWLYVYMSVRNYIVLEDLNSTYYVFSNQVIKKNKNKIDVQIRIRTFSY